MSSGASKSGAIHIIDSKLAVRPNLGAILFPQSASAQYSVSLVENGCVPYYNIAKLGLPSPDASSSEDEDSTEPSENISKDSTAHVSASRRRHTQGQGVILLDQTEANEKFTLGSAAKNDVVLKHPKSADENVCYINILHGQFYPDPDSSSIMLSNSSASVFHVQSLTGPHVDRTIAKDQEATVECGRWKVALGRGLDFEVEILPWTPSEIQGDLELISPVPVLYSPPAKYQVGRLANRTVGRAGAPSPEPNITTSGPAFRSYEVGELWRTTGKAVQFKLPVSSTSTTVDPPDVQIGKTLLTTVVKCVHNGIVSAIKICRRPTVKQSADAWKNEMEILNRLNHTSIVKLLDHDVPNMRLELVYVRLRVT